MYLKTFILFLWLGSSYALLLSGRLSAWGACLVAVFLGVAMAGIGFNVMHDGGHRSYSKRDWINRWMFYSLDLLGGNSYYWNWKHNNLHHSYTNIDQHDTDLEVGPFGRLSPHQKHLWFHRFQHLYLWFLYGLLAIKWQLFDDFFNLAVGKVGNNPVPRPKGKDLIHLFLGKMLFYFFAFLLPMYFFPWQKVLALYVLASFVEGLILAVVFQMAHCLEEAEFLVPPKNNDRIQQDWFSHQLATTVNFAPSSRFLSWYCGGLNYQIEHHLFPKVSHIHYPALSSVVRETCEEYGIAYRSHRTLWASLRSHYRWLKRMGRPPATPQMTPSAEITS
ncbi:MAG: acyl-CoA desaturase [Myxococcales bacterium]|nr:acyl-CoA desaturase [Myxococcales bacterium]